jgi:MoaA/NifB/PqqE/SkfB family radical SAM enzyme
MKPYCSAPQTGLFLNVDGGIKYCCAGGYDIGNIKNKTIDEIYSSETHKKIIHYIKNDISPPDKFCHVCEKVEKSDPTQSQRMHFNNDFVTDKEREWQWIDIRWTNQCNLSCRHCDSYFSSEWARIRKEPIESSNRDYFESVFEEIEKNLDSIKNVSLLGGEPFLQKQNLRLLDIISENPNIDIHIFTNLSHRLDKNLLYNKIKNLKNNIEFKLSIDGIGDQFEYVRAGAKWELILENIPKIKAVTETYFIKLVPVYCIWTADSIEKYYEFADKTNLTVMPLQGLGVINFGDSMLAYGHNDKIRERFIKKLESVNRSEFSSSLETLRNDKPVLNRNKEFLKNTLKVEKLVPPKYTFDKLWPELYQLLLEE